MKNTTKCFTVSGGDGFEIRQVIAVFSEKTLAKSFTKECSDYDKTEPSVHLENGAAHSNWCEKHPGGTTALISDEYQVDEIPYHTNPIPEGE